MSPIQAIRKSIRIDVSGFLHVQAPLAERKVTFDSQQEDTCIGSQTEDAEGLCWYTKQEIVSFRKRDNKYIQTLISSSRATSLTGDDDSDQVSLVGLRSIADHKQRLKYIREARACVTGEQLSQEEQFYSDHADLESFQLDHDIISEFYSSYSRRSSVIAHMRGLQVSCHVESLLWEEEQEQDNKSSKRCITTTTSGNRRPSRKYPLFRSPGSINIFSRLKRVG